MPVNRDQHRVAAQELGLEGQVVASPERPQDALLPVAVGKLGPLVPKNNLDILPLPAHPLQYRPNSGKVLFHGLLRQRGFRIKLCSINLSRYGIVSLPIRYVGTIY